jgi:hypothetical protein
MVNTTFSRLLQTAALWQLLGFSPLAHAATFQRHWADVIGLRATCATVVTKNGHCYRGRLVVTAQAAVIARHGIYEHWVAGQPKPLEIPKDSVARIMVRHRYRLTNDELADMWWYMIANAKGIFYPELSNLFPIAIAAHAGYTAWSIVYTPAAAIASILDPPALDTIEILAM